MRARARRLDTNYCCARARLVEAPGTIAARTNERSSRHTLDMRWAKQLELAASEVEEPDVPEAEGEVIFAEKYQSEHAYTRTAR